MSNASARCRALAVLHRIDGSKLFINDRELALAALISAGPHGLRSSPPTHAQVTLPPRSRQLNKEAEVTKRLAALEVPIRAQVSAQVDDGYATHTARRLISDDAVGIANAARHNFQNS